jgi:hypothetical protein
VKWESPNSVKLSQAGNLCLGAARAVTSPSSDLMISPAFQHRDQFGDFPALIIRVAALDGMLDAMADVALEQFVLDFS